MEFLNETSPENVVFSFQGAFGPPTFGHYISMKLFAEQVLNDYPNAKNIKMLFMPTAASSSKPHLIETQTSRSEILNKFCELLKEELSEEEKKRITFEASKIEYDLYKEQEPDKKSTATILTINKLNDNLINDYPNTTNNALCIGMGYDNMMQLPYWQGIDQYKDKVAKIYVVPRDLTNEEMANTLLFDVENEENEEKEKNTKAVMRFDVTVPWTNTTFLKCFLPDNNNNITLKKGEKDNLIKKLISVNNNGKEPYKFFQSLPRIVVIDKKIPATSSSMLRYFIYNYLSEENTIFKGEYLKKIKNIMFGPTSQDQEQLLVLVMDTINDYENKKLFNNNIPIDKNYETEYSSIEFQGGNNKTKRRRTNKKRKSQKKIYNKILPNYYVGTRKNQKKRSNKKFRSLRKRRSYKRV
jgi:nicotinic acid mononucleotide adenylyltransferase